MNRILIKYFSISDFGIFNFGIIDQNLCFTTAGIMCLFSFKRDAIETFNFDDGILT